MTPVTMVTKDATLDTLSVADYLDMIAELRTPDDKGKPMSYDKFIERIGSAWSKALWAKVVEGTALPNRSQRNELRAAMGEALLPMTVAEATAQASPDAAVWTVGDGRPDTVIMVSERKPITVHVNGAVSVVTDSFVTEVTGRQEKRRRYWRTCMSLEQKERTAALNQGKPPELQMTPQEIYDMGLKACGVTE